MDHILFFIYVLASAFVFALLEIQIEGKDAWASNLPTWRAYIKFPNMFNMSNSDKPLTGYHTYQWLFILLLVHFPFLFTHWTLQNELYVLSFYILFLSLEDFLYDMINPNFGIKKFNATYLPWNKSWFLGFPTQYWFRIPLGIILYILAIKFS